MCKEKREGLKFFFLTVSVGGHDHLLVIDRNIIAEVVVVPHWGADQRLKGPLRGGFWYVYMHDTLESVCRKMGRENKREDRLQNDSGTR